MKSTQTFHLSFATHLFARRRQRQCLYLCWYLCWTFFGMSVWCAWSCSKRLCTAHTHISHPYTLTHPHIEELETLWFYDWKQSGNVNTLLVAMKALCPFCNFSIALKWSVWKIFYQVYKWLMWWEGGIQDKCLLCYAKSILCIFLLWYSRYSLRFIITTTANTTTTIQL